MYCRNCGEPMNDNQAICLKCGVKKGGGQNYCENCGAEVNPNAAVCLSCGASIKGRNKSSASNDEYLGGRSKEGMAILAILLGEIGIHNFVMGEVKKGIVKIVLTCCFFLGWILALIDFVRILSGTYVIDPDKFF